MISPVDVNDVLCASLSDAELEAAIAAVPSEALAWATSEFGQLAGCCGTCEPCTQQNACPLAAKGRRLRQTQATRRLLQPILAFGTLLLWGTLGKQMP